ncbi:hypothetical protein MHYP_G00018430 [Metynnis hypsauchen]
MGEGGVEGLTGPLESAPCVRFAALQADISERTRTRTVILQPGAAAVSENTMAGQKSNVLGQHFTEPAPGQAKCNICSELVSMGAETGKTTNMWNHLKHHHLSVYKETQKEKEVVKKWYYLLYISAIGHFFRLNIGIGIGH